MKVLDVEFLEPVKNPLRAPGQPDQLQRYRAAEGAALRAHTILGVCVILEADASPVATVVPWTNVRWAHTERAAALEAIERRGAGKAK